MNDLVQIAAGTVSMRPYVFAFFAAYLIASVPHLGWKRVAAFTFLGYLTAFASELSSINTGFPYGWYYYIDRTSTKELWIAGVPFFDSLSYVFLCYCSYATALFILSPLKFARKNLILLETMSIRRSLPALFLGSLLQTYLDIIIDPVALQGRYWFLGEIYGYRESGHHFGVPLTNYLGWFLVSGLMIFILQRLASRKTGATPPPGVCFFPGSCLLPIILYLSVIIFNLVIAVSINQMTIAITVLFVMLLPTSMTTILAIRRTNEYSREELAEHLRDFPWSAAGTAKR
jgi:uncharacterized membrane protein